MKHGPQILAGMILGMCGCIGPAARAQTGNAGAAPAKPAAGGGKLEEVIVTAQRHKQRLQNVPISVNVLNAKKIEDMNITSPTGLTAAVPNMSVMLSGSTTFNPFIRGVGSVSGNPNDEPSVATYIDGVYIAAPNAVSALSLNGLDRIEVLKGPQGTLFGRNSTGGVIQIVTKEPSENTGGDIDLSYAQFDTFTINTYGTAKLADGLAADLAVYYNNEPDGYGRDLLTDAKTFTSNDVAVRSKLLITPADGTTIHLSFDYSKDDTHAAYQLAPGSIGVDGVTGYPGPFNFAGNFPMSNIAQQGGASVRVDQDLGPVRLVDIASYRQSSNLAFVDEDATPLNVVSATVHGQQRDYSEELQFLPSRAGRIDWVAGLFYFNNAAGDNPATIAGLAAAPLPYVDYTGIQHTSSLSGYGQATAEILPGTKLTLGARYTSETQNIHGLITSGIGILTNGGFQQTTFTKPTWRVALDHELLTGIHAYVSDTRGFKSGGFDIFAPGTPGYSPESLDAYEAGVKSELFGRRLFLNVAGFYYNYTSIQVTQAGAGFVFTRNAAAARIYGMDMDFQAVLTDQWRASGGLGLLDGKFTRFPDAVTYGPNAGPPIIFNAAGRDTPLTSPVTANFSTEYIIPAAIGDFRLGGSVSFNDGSYMDPGNRLRYPAYTLVNAYVGWTEARTGINVNMWAHNLTDATYYIQRYTTSLGDLEMQAPPRTVGVTLSKKF